MKNLVLLSALFAGALAAPKPVTSAHVLHERRGLVSDAWYQTTRADGNSIVPVRIGLTQQNLDRAEEILMEVSHHESPRYGKYYTAEEVHDLFSPSSETVEIVLAWLEEAGFGKDRVSQSANKQWMQFDASIEELESLVKAEYHVFEHETGKKYPSCDSYYVPEHIQPHVDYITPGIKLHHASTRSISDPSKLRKRTNYKLPILKRPVSSDTVSNARIAASKQSLAYCDSVVYPFCIKAMYNITVGTSAFPGNELGIFEDLGDHYAQEDLNNFFSNLYPKIPEGTHPTLEGIDGASGPIITGLAGVESDLDFEISYPIIWPQTDDAYVEFHYEYDGFFNNFLDGIDGSYCSYSAYGETGNSPLDPPYPDPRKGGYKGPLQCGVYKPTNVISISYGGAEFSLPASYQKRQCNEYMKLGLQGVSIVLASGDTGVSAGGVCLARNGTADYNGKIFGPGFPGTCPYLTTVGSTFLPYGASAAKDEEVATTRFGSGGGFSNIYPTPKYQLSSVETYLSDYTPPYLSYNTSNNYEIGQPFGVYNRGGRGFPDVSAIGDNVLEYNGGTQFLVGGTSAAAPTFAAILTRINEERLAAGKSTIGFVNPTLYSHPQVLHDITVGNNPGCKSTGFNASPGWDPVTGLGTPNFPAMLELFMSLP